MCSTTRQEQDKKEKIRSRRRRGRRSSMHGAKVEEEVLLPGFRFHPTDKELVGFYLVRQVDGRKRARIDHLIKHVNIYKYDPWDLPKANEEAGDKECLYFFCKRGRKYNNSARPNRVTGTGFWKATGIDKPVYNNPPEGEEDCLVIGLKKTLVYYRGSAGKGTKTDWMMQEFRLPPPDTKHDSSDLAEVWTVCKIFKRDVMQKRYASGWREPTINNKLIQANQNQRKEYVAEMGSTCYISFGSLPSSPMAVDQETTTNNLDTVMMGRSLSDNASFSSNNCIPKIDHGFTYDDWDELRSVVECAFDHSSSHQVQDD